MKEKKKYGALITGAAAVLILCIAVVLNMPGPAASETGAEISQGSEKAKTEYSRGYVDLEMTSEGAEITNRRDGYRLLLPESICGRISCSELGIEIDAEDREYKIYMEKFEDKQDISSYLAYSNRFIDNTEDHKESFVKTDDSGKHHMQITGWNRETLKGIDGDMNNYICVDVVFSDQQVCTVFGRSSEGENLEEEVISLARAVELIDKKAIDRHEREYWSEETAEVYDRYFGEESGFTWGVYKWGIDENWDHLTDLEDRLEYSFDILLYYSHFESKDSLERVKRVLTSAHEEGRTVELTLQTKFSEDGNMVYDILNGEYDVFIRDYGKLLAELKIPVLFRLCNEMNGDWCQYSAFHTSRDTEIFNEMYRYIYDIFMEEGAGAYTIWVWNPNEKSFPDYKWNHEYNYYPGDEYVDVIGITGYNTGTYYEGEVWRSFDEIYEPIYERALKNYSKPIMITEFGCADTGGDKEEWVKDMFESLKDYSGIKAAVWWDGCDYDEDGNVARSYLIEENEELIELFRKGFGDED